MMAAQLLTSFSLGLEGPSNPQPAAKPNAYLQPPLIPDLSVEPSDISVEVANGSSAMFGRWVAIQATIRNLGEPNESSFEYRIGIRESEIGYNYTIQAAVLSGAFPNETTNFTEVYASWNVNVADAVSFEIWVLVDSTEAIEEISEENNFVTVEFDIEALVWEFTLVTDKTEYVVGENVALTMLIVYGDTHEPIPYLQPTLEMVDLETGTPVPYIQISSWGPAYYPNGGLIATLTIPSDIEPGSYSFHVRLLYEWRDCPNIIEIKSPPHPLVSSEVLAAGTATTVVVVLFVTLYILDSRRVKK